MTRRITNVGRALVVLVFVTLALVCVALTGLLAVSGYLVWLIGSSKGALAVWAMACCPLVFLGLVGSYLPQWLNPGPTPSGRLSSVDASLNLVQEQIVLARANIYRHTQGEP